MITGLTGSLYRRDFREGAMGKESSRASKPITPASPCKACLQIWKSPISCCTIFWGNPSRFYTNAGAASLGTWRSFHSTPVGAPPGAVSCPCRAHSAYADPAAESEGVCPAAVCRIRPLQPETAPGMYARRTICKHVANNRRRSHPLKQYPETVQKLGKCPPSKALEDQKA